MSAAVVTVGCQMKVRSGSARVEGGADGKWAGQRLCKATPAWVDFAGRQWCERHAPKENTSMELRRLTTGGAR